MVEARNPDNNQFVRIGHDSLNQMEAAQVEVKPDLGVSNSETSALDQRGDYGAIVSAAIQGSLEAFEQLYNLHADQIYRYVFYRVSQHADSEDLVAQVFLQAWSNIKNYKNNGSPFVAWLYTIAHNLVINYYKKSERQAKLQMPLGEWMSDVQHPQDLYLEFSTKMQNEALRRAILKLGKEQQQVIYFRYVEDMSHQEIATLLNKSAAAIRVVQFRAQRALRQLLEQEEWADAFNQG